MSENIYRKLLAAIDRSGYGILTGGTIHPDIPLIHDVGHERLPTDTPVEHIGYGLLEARVGGRTISFDGGGAMYHVSDAAGAVRFSYTHLRASAEQYAAMGYDLDRVKAALEELAQEYERKEIENV